MTPYSQQQINALAQKATEMGIDPQYLISALSSATTSAMPSGGQATNRGLLGVVNRMLGNKPPVDQNAGVAGTLIDQNKQKAGLAGLGGTDVGILNKIISMFGV